MLQAQAPQHQASAGIPPPLKPRPADAPHGGHVAHHVQANGTAQRRGVMGGRGVEVRARNAECDTIPSARARSCHVGTTSVRAHEGAVTAAWLVGHRVMERGAGPASQRRLEAELSMSFSALQLHVTVMQTTSDT